MHKAADTHPDPPQGREYELEKRMFKETDTHPSPPQGRVCELEKRMHRKAFSYLIT